MQLNDELGKHANSNNYLPTHGGGWPFYQNFIYLALTVWERQCFEDGEEKDHLATHWIK